MASATTATTLSPVIVQHGDQATLRATVTGLVSGSVSTGGKVQFSIDGNAVTPLVFMPQSDGTIQIGYMLPGDFPAGSHTATAQVSDTTGQCGQKSWTFLSTNSSVSPT